METKLVDWFCCPQCHAPLEASSAAYRCPECPREYPIVYGIPDFRLDPDPYISFEAEYQKAGRLAEQAERLSFEALLRYYWQITPNTPPAATERYVQYALDAEERGRSCLEELDTYRQGEASGNWSGHACLELGCGTGGFLLAARSRFDTVVGIDIALRWLIIAKKRIENSRAHIILACCSATHLPFRAETFDGVVGLHVLEHVAHVQHQQALVSETGRTLKQPGMCLFSTPNRWSIGPEPCVRVWGVGFLPRVLAPRWVWFVKGLPYQHIQLLSRFELGRLLAHSGLRAWTIAPLRIAACEQRSVSRFVRCLIRVYHAVCGMPGGSLLMQLCGPLLRVIGHK